MKKTKKSFKEIKSIVHYLCWDANNSQLIYNPTEKQSKMLHYLGLLVGPINLIVFVINMYFVAPFTTIVFDISSNITFSLVLLLYASSSILLIFILLSIFIYSHDVSQY